MVASLSAHLGLQKLGQNDKLSLNDYAFTGSNIDLIDALIYRLLQHHHDGQSPASVTPTQPLSAVVSNTGGALPAGVTVRYKYTLVDSFGTESEPSPEVSITTPPAISSPQAPALSYAATGGTVLSGTYVYLLTAWTGENTNETTAGPSSVITLASGSSNRVTITLPTLPAGADGFNIYRRAPGEVAMSFLSEVDMSGATPPTYYLDDGLVEENCNRFPSTVNNTNSSNKIDLSFPGATPTVPTGYTWKLYRTLIGGSYTNSLLAHVVEEVSPGYTDPTFTDTGISTTSGSPPAQGFTIPALPKVDLTLGAEVQGTLPPGMSITPLVVEFQYNGQLATGPSDYIWTNVYDKAQIMDVQCYFSDMTRPVESQNVIVDIERYNLATPSWGTIYGSTTRRARVDIGEVVGQAFSTTSADDRYFERGDFFRLNIVQRDGVSGDQNLTVAVRLYVAIDAEPTFTFDGE